MNASFGDLETWVIVGDGVQHIRKLTKHLEITIACSFVLFVTNGLFNLPLSLFLDLVSHSLFFTIRSGPQHVPEQMKWKQDHVGSVQVVSLTNGLSNKNALCMSIDDYRGVQNDVYDFSDADGC